LVGFGDHFEVLNENSESEFFNEFIGVSFIIFSLPKVEGFFYFFKVTHLHSLRQLGLLNSAHVNG
jgi:hypothetical protein